MTGEDRGTSALVGVVLLFGLVVVGSVGVLLIGGQVNEESRQRAETVRVEQSFLELGATLNDLARSEGGEQTVDLDLPRNTETDGAVRESATGRIWVNRTNFSAAKTDTLVNESVGSIRYDGERTVAYQAGAVFRGTGNETVLLSNPGFQYSVSTDGNKPTLSLPIVTTVGPDRISSGEVRATKVAANTPVNDETIVEDDLVSITVQSEYYLGWAAYFRELAARSDVSDTAVTVDHSRQTATFELIVPVTRQAVAGGIVGGSSSGTMRLTNSVNLSSYNSSKCRFGGGCASTKDEADIVVSGNLTLRNQAHVGGDAVVGGTLRTGSSTKLPCPGSTSDAVICGNASYGDSWINSNGGSGKTKSDLVGNWYEDNATIEGYEPVNDIIDARVNRALDGNDNANVSAITGRSFAGCTSPCTLTTGTYIVEEIVESDLQGKELRFDTSGGRIDLVVNGSIDLKKTYLNVTGGERVNVYVDSDKSGPCALSGGGAGCDFEYDASNNSVRDASGSITDNAAHFWVYTDDSADAVFRTSGFGGGGDPEFTGVLFGPGASDEPGVNTSVGNSMVVQGALVGNVSQVKNSAEIRYDRRLHDSKTVVSTTRVPRLTFLVASTYVLAVEDD